MRYTFVASYGLLWKISRRKLKTLLTAIAQGRVVNFDDYGKQIGIYYNFTDLDETRARELLEDLEL